MLKRALVYTCVVFFAAINAREGSFTGMLNKRRFNIVWVSPQHPQLLNGDTKKYHTINYTGNKVTIKFNQ